MAVQESALIGTWKSDPNDSTGASTYGNVTLKFGADGTLLYIIREQNRDQVMRLTYHIEPGFIVTNQPSEPRSERTEYQVAEGWSSCLGVWRTEIQICEDKVNVFETWVPPET